MKPTSLSQFAIRKFSLENCCGAFCCAHLFVCLVQAFEVDCEECEGSRNAPQNAYSTDTIDQGHGDTKRSVARENQFKANLRPGLA